MVKDGTSARLLEWVHNISFGDRHTSTQKLCNRLWHSGLVLGLFKPISMVVTSITQELERPSIMTSPPYLPMKEHRSRSICLDYRRRYTIENDTDYAAFRLSRRKIYSLLRSHHSARNASSEHERCIIAWNPANEDASTGMSWLFEWSCISKDDYVQGLFKFSVTLDCSVCVVESISQLRTTTFADCVQQYDGQVC